MEMAWVNFNSDYSIYGEYPKLWDELRFKARADVSILQFLNSACQRMLRDTSALTEIIIGLDDKGFTVVAEAYSHVVTTLKTYYDNDKGRYCLKCDVIPGYNADQMFVIFLVALQIVDSINFFLRKQDNKIPGVPSIVEPIQPSTKVATPSTLDYGITIESFDLPDGEYTFHKWGTNNAGVSRKDWTIETGSPFSVGSNLIEVAPGGTGFITINYESVTENDVHIDFTIASSGIVMDLTDEQKLEYGLSFDSVAIAIN